MNMTANPIDMDIIGQEGRASILRQIAKDFDLHGIVPSRDVIRQRMEEQAANPQPNPEQIKAQAAAQLAEIKEVGANERLQIELEFKAGERDAARIKDDKQHQQRMAEIQAKKEIALDKQAKDEAQAIRLMREETARITERNEINAEVDAEKHSMDMELKEKDQEIAEITAKASADATVAAANQPKPEPAKAYNSKPLELTVIVDNKGGVTKKTIKINRDKAGRADTLESEETTG
jgi:hypothetical protein